MAIKTTKTKVNSSVTSSEIDLFAGVRLPRAVKRDVAQVAGELILDSIKSDLDKRKSSVDGSNFQKLNKDYAKMKRAAGLRGVPDLQLTSQMIDELDANVTGAGLLNVGVFGSSAPRADGHNNLSGKSSLPLRQSLPKEGEGFRSGIQRELQAIVNEAVADNVRLPVRRLGAVTTKAEFFEILRESFGPVSNAAIRSSILANEDLLTQLSSRNLTRFL